MERIEIRNFLCDVIFIAKPLSLTKSFKQKTLQYPADCLTMDNKNKAKHAYIIKAAPLLLELKKSKISPYEQ